jgi:hypothetical protein
MHNVISEDLTHNLHIPQNLKPRNKIFAFFAHGFSCLACNDFKSNCHYPISIYLQQTYQPPSLYPVRGFSLREAVFQKYYQNTTII